jgi:hypothetical protein
MRCTKRNAVGYWLIATLAFSVHEELAHEHFKSWNAHTIETFGPRYPLDCSIMSGIYVLTLLSHRADPTCLSYTRVSVVTSYVYRQTRESWYVASWTCWVCTCRRVQEIQRGLGIPLMNSWKWTATKATICCINCNFNPVNCPGGLTAVTDYHTKHQSNYPSSRRFFQYSNARRGLLGLRFSECI